MAGSVRLLEQQWKTAAPWKRSGLEVLRPEQQIRRGRPVETEAPLALGIQRDEGERGVGRFGAHHLCGGDAGGFEALQQEITEGVLCQHADEGRRPCRGAPAATATLAGAPPA